MKKESTHNQEGETVKPGPGEPEVLVSKDTNSTKPLEKEFDRQEAISHIREVIRTDRSEKSYEKFFGEIPKPKGMILDLAAGDSNFAETINKDGKLKVIRCDFGYSKIPPSNKEGAVAGLAQELPFQNQSFEKVVSSCLFEHLRAKDATGALSEILRVTKKGGEIMIYPSYRPLQGKYDFAQRKILAEDIVDRIKLKLASQPTLIIQNKESLTTEEWNQAVSDLAQSVRLPSFAEKIERWFMKLRLHIKGDVRMHR